MISTQGKNHNSCKMQVNSMTLSSKCKQFSGQLFHLSDVRQLTQFKWLESVPDTVRWSNYNIHKFNLQKKFDHFASILESQSQHLSLFWLEFEGWQYLWPRDIQTNIIVFILKTMNYFPFTTYLQHVAALKGGQKDYSEQNHNAHAILAMIEIALTADFARFENKVNARALISQLQTQVQLPTVAMTRSASQPELRTPKISTSQPERRLTQKSQHVKRTSAPKEKIPKSQSTIRPAPPTPSKQAKEVKPSAASGSNCSKHKKKIHKIPEPKKEPARRSLQPSMLETADLPRMRLSDREKKKIRRLLLLRHVKEWVRPMEQRREGRELRHQH